MLLSQVIPSLLLKLSYRTVMFIVSVRFSINMPCTSYCYREVAHYSCKISKVSIFNHIMQFTKSSGQNNLCTHRTASFIIMKPSVKFFMGMIVCYCNRDLCRWKWNYWWSRQCVVGYVEERYTALHKASPTWADDLFWYHRLQRRLPGFPLLEHSSCLLQVSITIPFAYTSEFSPESQKRSPDYSQN